MRTILMHSADYALHTNHDIMAFEDIFSDLKELEKNSKISKADLLEVLRKYCTNISVFDLMKFNSRFVDETDYVPNDFFKKVHETSFNSVFTSIKSINDETLQIKGNIDKNRFINSRGYLEERFFKRTDDNETIRIAIIIDLYKIFIEEKPIHPINMPFPGNLKIVEENGHYYCPARKNNMENPITFCRICIAEELEF